MSERASVPFDKCRYCELTLGCLDILPSQLENIKNLPVDSLINGGFEPINGLNLAAKNLDATSRISGPEDTPINIGAHEIVRVIEDEINYPNFSTLREMKLTQCISARIGIGALKKNTPYRL